MSKDGIMNIMKNVYDLKKKKVDQKSLKNEYVLNGYNSYGVWWYWNWKKIIATEIQFR